MFSVAAYYKDGRVDLLGFAYGEDQVNEMIDKYIRKHGADFLGAWGVRFIVELAV